MNYYRFNDGVFVEARSFPHAQRIRIRQIEEETEDLNNWHKCTCLGLSHRFDCPENAEEIPY